ncbi:MAG: hypothetical protein MJ092_07065 [Lachnospiraceae bacterium]|nr:hypothetical protein [Lachnospiraceae bacterium]
MKLEDIQQKLSAELPEEIQGAADYHEAALAAKEAGEEMLYAYLTATAKDEMQHAKWIYEYMEENRLPIPEPTKERYKELERAHKF